MFSFDQKENPFAPKASLDDLQLVGPKKPLGYLTEYELEVDCNSSIEEQARIALSKGLDIVLIEGPKCADTLYVYDPVALRKLIDHNLPLLEECNLPTDPDAFIRYIDEHTVEGPSLGFDFIANCFGNYTNTGRTEFQQRGYNNTA